LIAIVCVTVINKAENLKICLQKEVKSARETLGSFVIGKINHV
jgi:hypothetical protein